MFNKYLIISIAFAVVTSMAMVSVQKEKVKAFPGAEGLGCYSLGGRGGEVIYVTNLNDDGPGSLRSAIEIEGPRIVLFKVSGIIALESDLTIKNPFITIAGQTAPGDGICLKNYNFSVQTDNVIVRYLRVRLGDESNQETDAVTVSGKNVIMDHISASWSVDEVFSLTGKPDSVSVQWCMITEALRYSKHHKGKHSYGSLIKPREVSHLSVHHNLYAHNDSRNPRPGNYWNKILYLEFINNVIYDYGMRAGYSGGGSFNEYETFPEPVMMNYIGNYLKAGPSSTAKSAFNGGSVDTWIYQQGNIFNGINSGWGMFSGDYSKLEKPFEISKEYHIEIDEAESAFVNVVENMGAILPAIDPVDNRIRKDIMDGTGNYIDSQNEVGGWPDYSSIIPPDDSDNDGMPDFWEIQFGFNPQNTFDNNLDMDGDGYTNIEEYLNNTDPTNSGNQIVFVSASVNKNIENDLQKGEYTLWRKGSLENDLTIKVNITVLVGAPKFIAIPAGTDRVKIKIACDKISNSEVIISIMEDDIYKIGCPSKSLITVSDK